MPTLDHRSIQLALTFLRYFYNQKNPNATEEQFQASLSVESAANAAASVKKQMQETITLDELKEFQKVQSLNLTRVNKDRQVQD
jgi:acetyl-CoA acetyltransferase